MRRSTNGPEPTARGNFTPPPRSAAAPGSAAEAAPLPPAGSRLAPRNWRVPARLNAILLIPVVVGLVMGGFQVSGSIDTWREARDAEDTARLVRAALSYSERLINERDVSAVPLLRGDKRDPDVLNARAATDQAAQEFGAAAARMPRTEGLERRLDAFHTVEPGLAGLRAAAYTSKLSGVRTEEGYVAIQHPLMEFANELGLGTGNITSYGRTVYAISLAKAALSLERSLGMHLLTRPGPGASDFGRQRVALSSYAYLEGIAVEEYTSGGTERDVAALESAERRLASEAAEEAEDAAAKAEGGRYVPPPSAQKMTAALSSLPSTDAAARRALAAKGVTPENWWATNTAKFDAYRTIEANLADKAVTEASGIADDAKRDTLVSAAAVVVALLAAFVLAGLMARQMSHSMRRLRTAAFSIAEQRLPTLVDQLSRTDPGRVDTRVEPIPINTTDEIGEVARAFDQVHREAVRLASEQAMLRGNINAIFTNLSRRNQSLIEGQLSLITGLENNEADPDQLESLFRLDHLATRMRRNGENLLVLAGEEPGRRWDRPVPLVDVLRAASSEVEQYERIELTGVPEAEIHGLAVTDLVHLLAELLENATTFSSPGTRVRVTATRLPDGRIMIEIHDKGIGLTAEDFADINHKLANPPTVDVAISQRMGLFVVGRLSDRHGIRVQLRPSGEQTGTTSLVMLPEAITRGGQDERSGTDDGFTDFGEPTEFTVSSIMPRRDAYEIEQGPVARPPLRTAAELGFDDSRYAQAPDAPGPLDPVGRSLRREERRAALEAQAQQGQEARSGDGNGPGPLGRSGREPGRDGAPGGQDGPLELPGREQTHGDRSGYAPQPGYGDAAAYGDGSGADDARSWADPGAYEEYDGYRAGAYGNGAGYPPQEPPSGGFGGPGGYPEPDGGPHPGMGYPEAGEVDPAESGGDPYALYEAPSHQRDWPGQGGFEQPEQDEYAPQPESPQRQLPEARRDAHAPESHRVGFPRQGPAASSGHGLTDAGLPRRGGPADTGSGPSAPWQPQSGPGDTPLPADREPSGDGSPREARRSSTDERWERAERLRKPEAGGTTASGLPRRVPKANLVEGAAEQAPRGGPQVSRAPEDVRGRLSNLRRGVQRGRSAGSDTNGQGLGPDSTYDQER